jgi:hypothetical protein
MWLLYLWVTIQHEGSMCVPLSALSLGVAVCSACSASFIWTLFPQLRGNVLSADQHSPLRLGPPTQYSPLGPSSMGFSPLGLSSWSSLP